MHVHNVRVEYDEIILNCMRQLYINYHKIITQNLYEHVNIFTYKHMKLFIFTNIKNKFLNVTYKIKILY